MKKIGFLGGCLLCLLLAGCSQSSDDAIVVDEPISPEDLSARYYVAQSGSVEDEVHQSTQTENQVVEDEVKSLADQGVIPSMKD